MARTMSFRIGADASCTDGACGQVSRVIVNPVAREVTHLVVDPKHRIGPGRLVPVDLVDATTGQIRLRCTLAEFQTLRPAEETEVVPDLDPAGHPPPGEQTQYRLAGGGGLVWTVRVPAEPEGPQEVTVDSVPFGEVEVPRPDRPCDRRRDRAGPGAGRGNWRPPCNWSENRTFYGRTAASGGAPRRRTWVSGSGCCG
jgi:hypothetical protein